MYNTLVSNGVDHQEEKIKELTNALNDLIASAEAGCTRHAEEYLDNLEEVASTELGLLDDAKAATEAVIDSTEDDTQEDVIYIKHVLANARPGSTAPNGDVVPGGNGNGNGGNGGIPAGNGGADPFAGFGLAPSSFFGKGNVLTGIDALDLLIEGAIHGDKYNLAQVADKPNGGNGGNGDNGVSDDPEDLVDESDEENIELRDELDEAIQDLQDQLQAAKDEFSEQCDHAKEDAADRADNLVD